MITGDKDIEIICVMDNICDKYALFREIIPESQLLFLHRFNVSLKCSRRELKRNPHTFSMTAHTKALSYEQEPIYDA